MIWMKEIIYAHRLMLLKAKIVSMPGKYPVIVSMTAAQPNDLEDQIGVTTRA